MKKNTFFIKGNSREYHQSETSTGRTEQSFAGRSELPKHIGSDVAIYSRRTLVTDRSPRTVSARPLSLAPILQARANIYPVQFEPKACQSLLN